MLQSESFRVRDQYRVTKVTTKMLFSVAFHSRPLDHFLALEAVRYQPQHDSTQWGGSEPPPSSTIESPEQLLCALHAIMDAASAWYPEDLARVFRAIHGHAAHHLFPRSANRIVIPFCNFYNAVFVSVFINLVDRVDTRDIEDRVLDLFRRDSYEWCHFVDRELNDMMVDAVLHGPSDGPARRSQGRKPDNVRNRPQPSRTSSPQRRATTIPADVRRQIPMVDGHPVCIQFQTIGDCDFRKCKNTHSFAHLPPDLLQWAITAHEQLKSDHPQA